MRRSKDFLRSEYFYLCILVVVILVVGLITVRAYGESWDELKFYKYADSALEAYGTWPGIGEVPVTGNTYDNYGPAYVMFVSVSARALRSILPWLESDLRHLIYFFTFLAGIWAFYALCRRWLSQVPAAGATLLFATQPLFWGHAFISPKDIPFLTFFLLSLVFGFRMVDSFGPLAPDAAADRNRRRVILLTASWLALVVLMFGGTPVFRGQLEGAVRAAAGGASNLVSWIASDIHTAAPEVYIRKYFVLFLQVRAIFFWIGTAALVWLCRRTIPATFHFLWPIAPAAIFLGLTICIRVLGPLAGLIVLLYAWHQKGRKIIGLLVIYVFLALAVMYATWPYLWPNPVGNFVESVIVMAKYPWRGRVLFDGVMYASTAIPRSYLPILLGIQLTEPVWFLFAAGFVMTAYGAIGKQLKSLQLLTLTLIWFALPVVGFIALRSPLYDNFRQIFFVLPPVFVMSAVVFEKIKRPLLQVVLIVLVLLPGVVDGLRLHPYEYIYYNRFIGGPAGAFRRFELDYWGISFREAAGYVNQNAPANATIWVEGPTHLFQLYARPDIKTYSTNEVQRADHYNCVVAMTRDDLDLRSYPEAQVIERVARGNAVLAVIKQPADRSCTPAGGE